VKQSMSEQEANHSPAGPTTIKRETIEPWEDIPPKQAGWKQALALLTHDKAALFSLMFLIIWGPAALFAPVLIDEAALKVNFDLRFVPPSFQHVFGTGPLGRDLFSRVLLASRNSLTIAFIVVVSSGLFGMARGVIAGY